MNAAMKEILFRAFDETEHVYTWDYRKYQNAVRLLDVNSEYFAMISHEGYVDEETGAMLDYRAGSDYTCYLYSKTTIKVVEKITFREIEELISDMKKKSWGSGIKEVESITLTTGNVCISNGDLVLERKEVKEND